MSGTRRPSVPGPRRRAGSGRWATSSVTAAGQQPRHQRPRARRELRQRGEGPHAIEEHHRRRLVGRPALERVEPRDRGLARRVARRARRPCRRGTRRPRRRRCRRERRRGHRRPTPRASMPGEVAARPRSIVKPAVEQRRSDVGLPGPCRPPAPRTRTLAQRGDEAAVDVEPVRAGVERQRRLVGHDLGRQLRAVLARRAGWRRRRRPARQTGSSRSPSSELDGEARAARRSRARPPARPALDSVRHHAQVRPLVGQRQRDRARAGADVDHPRALRQAERRLDHVLGLGPRDQHARVDLQLDAAGSPCGRGCRRPARARAGAARSRGSGCRLDPAAGVGDEHGAVDAHGGGEQHLGVEPRRVAAGRGERDQRGVERVADRGAGERAAHAPRKPTRARADAGRGSSCDRRHGERHAAPARSRSSAAPGRAAAARRRRTARARRQRHGPAQPAAQRDRQRAHRHRRDARPRAAIVPSAALQQQPLAVRA